MSGVWILSVFLNLDHLFFLIFPLCLFIIFPFHFSNIISFFFAAFPHSCFCLCVFFLPWISLYESPSFPPFHPPIFLTGICHFSSQFFSFLSLYLLFALCVCVCIIHVCSICIYRSGCVFVKVTLSYFQDMFHIRSSNISFSLHANISLSISPLRSRVTCPL